MEHGLAGACTHIKMALSMKAAGIEINAMVKVGDLNNTQYVLIGCERYKNGDIYDGEWFHDQKSG